MVSVRFYLCRSIYNAHCPRYLTDYGMIWFAENAALGTGCFHTCEQKWNFVHYSAMVFTCTFLRPVRYSKGLYVLWHTPRSKTHYHSVSSLPLSVVHTHFFHMQLNVVNSLSPQ